MTVTFQLDWRDFRAWNRALDRASLRQLWSKWFLVAMIVLPHAASGWRGLMEAVAATLVVDIGLYLLMLGKVKKLIGKCPIASRVITLCFGEDDITTSAGQPLFWSAIKRIVETRKHFFIVAAFEVGKERLSFEGPLIIPKRAFDSPARCAEFGALLKAKWAEHHAGCGAHCGGEVT